MGDRGMTKIYLIRHAEAEGNLYRLAQGHFDGLITERGYLQIGALRRRFADIPVDAVYSSDLFRTRTTARAIYEPKGLPLHTDPALREVGMGVWEGRPWQELGMEDPEQMYCFNRKMEDWHVEGGETIRQVLDRFLPALRKIAEDNDGRTVAVVSHGMVLRIVLGTLQGMTMEQLNATHHGDNTNVSLVEYENGEFRVVFTNDNSHLTAEGLSTFARQTWWKDKHMAETGVYYGPMDDKARAELTAEGAQVPEGGHLTAVLYEGKAIGGVQTMEDGQIRWYYLLPAWRGKRFGVPPLGQAVRYARELGLESVWVEDPGQELRPFFTKLGFRESGGRMVKCIVPEEREIP